MRTLILHGSNDLYGASRVLISEVRILIALGAQVTVTLPSEGDLTNRLRELGAVVSIDPGLHVIRRRTPLRALGAMTENDRFKGFDMVVLWTLALAAYIPPLIARRHAFYVSVHELLEGPTGYALRSLLGLGSFPVTTCSDAVASWVTDGPVAAARVVTTRPVLSKQDLEIAESNMHRPPREGRPPTLAVVGRTNGHKGHYEVVRALQSQALSAVDVRLLIAGSPFPGQEAAHQRIIDAAARDHRVTVLGQIPSIDTLRGKTDLILCFPTKPEPFGLVPIEAWKNGIHAIGYGAGGAGEALRSVNGVIIDGPMNEKDLAKVISTALVHESTWSPLPSAATVGEVYSLERRSNHLENVLQMGLLR